MYTIDYNFLPNDTVWIIDGNSVSECTVTKITLEADPASEGGIEEISTYHLHLKDTNFDIVLRPPEELFATLSDIMDYIANGTPPVQPPPTPITYKFAVNEIVWTVEDDTPIICRVVQITFDVDENGDERTTYHVLPPPDTYSVLLRSESLLFHTEEEAIEYIINKKLEGMTPTPTNTAALTPTPTPTPSAYHNAVLEEDFDFILLESGDVLEEE